MGRVLINEPNNMLGNMVTGVFNGFGNALSRQSSSRANDMLANQRAVEIDQTMADMAYDQMRREYADAPNHDPDQAVRYAMAVANSPWANTTTSGGSVFNPTQTPGAQPGQFLTGPDGTMTTPSGRQSLAAAGASNATAALRNSQTAISDIVLGATERLEGNQYPGEQPIQEWPGIPHQLPPESIASQFDPQRDAMIAGKTPPKRSTSTVTLDDGIWIVDTQTGERISKVGNPPAKTTQPKTIPGVTQAQIDLYENDWEGLDEDLRPKYEYLEKRYKGTVLKQILGTMNEMGVGGELPDFNAAAAQVLDPYVMGTVPTWFGMSEGPRSRLQSDVSLPHPQSLAERDALPSGTRYITPDGRVATRP